MNVIVFEDETYYKMLEEFSKLIKDAAKEMKAESEWLSTDEAKKLLGFKSKSKLQQLRDAGEIIFSQNGRIIKYSRKSILGFLERNTVRN